jgi:hypothetical protein
MEILFSPYQLTPKKRLNRLSSMDPKKGAYLSAVINGKRVFADYFPHIPLGDLSVEEFLSTFKEQKTEYQRKILKLLHDDSRFQSFPSMKFRNHQLWAGTESINSPVVKYKMLHPHDHTFHEALRTGIRVRLDANAMFNSGNMNELLDPIKEEWKKLIDYVEDPLNETDWSKFPLRRARDFINGTPYDLYIYKPNCEMLPKSKDVIYSAYLGSPLGSWHTYCELVENGNLQVVQGIIGLGFYQEVRDFYHGNFHQGFYPDLLIIRELYQELGNREWKVLCSM